MNYRSNEWTMAIHWALDRLEKLFPTEVFDKMKEASCNPFIPIDAGGNYPIIHGETGDLMAGVPYAKGLRVSRSKMRALSAKGIEVQVSAMVPTSVCSLVKQHNLSSIPLYLVFLFFLFFFSSSDLI